MKTAIQNLEELLKDNLKEIVLKQDYKLMEELFSNALEEEKVQIVNAFENGGKYPYDVGINHAEEYYNQIYKL